MPDELGPLPADENAYERYARLHFSVASRFFRTFNQATAPVSENCRA